MERHEYLGPIPDPEGYPVYREPKTGRIYRCIATYNDPASIRGWYALDIAEDTGSDMIFFGLISEGRRDRLGTFRRSEVVRICNGGLEFDPEGLQGLEPPLIGLDARGRDIRWEKLDGPVRMPRGFRAHTH